MNFIILFLILVPIKIFSQQDAYELLAKAKSVYKNNSQKSEEYLNLADKIFLMNGNKNGLMETQSLRIEIYQRNGKKQELYLALKELEKLSNEQKNLQNLVKTYKNLFDFFMEIEIYDTALHYIQKLKYLGEKHGFSEDITNVYGYLGSFYSKLKKYDLSKDYLLKSLELKADKNSPGIYSEIGNNYYYMQKYDSALFYYLQANKIAMEFHDTLAIAYTLNNIGLYYKVKEDYKNAINYFKEALIYYDYINNRYGFINIQSNIAQVFYTQKKYLEAIEICQKYYSEAKENEYIQLAYELSKVLAESYEKIKNYEKSTIYFKEFLTLTDSIYQSKFRMLNSECEFRMNMIKNKDKNQLDLMDANEVWFYLFLLTLAVLIILVLFIYALFKKFNIHWSNFFSNHP